MKKTMNRILAVLLSFVMVVVPMFLYLEDTIVLEANVAEFTKELASTSENVFPYTDPAIYVADCITKGIVNKEGVPAGGRSQVNTALLQKYTYQLMAESLVEDEIRVWSSAIWYNFNNIINGELLKLGDGQKVFYEVILMDYMMYSSGTNEFENNCYDSKLKYDFEIFKMLTDQADKLYQGNVDNLINNTSLTDAVEYSNQYGFIYDLNNYTKLTDNLVRTSTTITEYYENLSKALVVRDINQGRIDFLKAVKSRGTAAGDTYLVAAADEIIGLMEKSFSEINFEETLTTFVNYTNRYVVDILIDKYPPLAAVKFGTAGINWLINGEERAENNLKLLVIYIINSYVAGALRDIRDTYTASNTRYNAEKLLNVYGCYLDYQKYATDCARGFTSASLLEGGWNALKNLVSTDNMSAYEAFRKRFSDDNNFCNNQYELFGTNYDFYFGIIGIDFMGDTLKIYGSCGENVYYKLYGKVLEIFGTGDMSFSHLPPWNKYDKDIYEVVIKDGVTSIGSSAFDGCVKLNKLTIPDSVISIGDRVFHDCNSLTSVSLSDKINYIGEEVFYSCSRLTSINVDSNNQSYISVDGVLFSKDMKKLKAYPCNKSGNSYSIPYGVITISKEAFSLCDNLYNITIPNTVKTIKSYAFRGCSNLGSIIIPNSVIEIERDAFFYCDGLTSVTLPNYMTTLKSIFYHCDSLRKITIPDCVTVLDGTFNWSTNLESIVIPENVTLIGDHTFRECRALKNIIIPDKVTSIGDYAFATCLNLKSISIPVSVTNIGDSAFEGCNSLTDVYYNGTKSQWRSIYIDIDNERLKNANIHYLVEEPTVEEETLPPTTPTEPVPEETLPPTIPTEPTPSVPESPELITVYFENSNNWGKINYYILGGSLDMDWPGEKCTNIRGNIWSATIPSDSKYIIFNDGNRQTADMVLNGGNKIARLNGNSSTNDYGDSHPSATWYTYYADILGDVDGDSIVSVVDATKVQLYLAEKIEISEKQIELADTNKDSVISIMDATRLQMFLAQIIPSLYI